MINRNLLGKIEMALQEKKTSMNRAMETYKGTFI